MKLTSKQYEQEFLNSELAVEIKKELELMESDAYYATNGSYAPALGGDISFTDKHFAYLSLNQNVKPNEYLSNLRLKTRIHK